MRITPLYTLVYKEVYRFMRLFRQTVIPPVITTLLFILIFGYSLGSAIRKIEGFDYIIYILPGLAQMGVINNAYQNSSTSLFMSRMERSIENVLTAPLGYIEIVLSQLLGSVLRGLTVGYTILLVAYFFQPFPLPHFGWLCVSWTLTATLFGAFGIVFALLSKTWDHIALFGNFILMPLIYLGGVFYSIKMLPPFWQKISYANPVFYAIDSTRYAILGVSDIAWYQSFGITLGMTVVLVLLCVYLFKRGVNMVS